MATVKERQKTDPTLMLTPTQLDYWIVKHGMTKEEAKQKVRERQQTNSLERFIQRANGDEEEGRKNWLQRQEKWLNSLEERGWYGNHSEVSQKLFRSIEELTDIPIRYGDNEITLRVGDRYCKPDCIAQSTRKIIEFFGDYWHANPEMYQADQAVRRLDEGGFITAKEIWKKDLARIELLEQHDYVVRIVWENEYTENPSETVSDCVKFLSTPLNMGCS